MEVLNEINGDISKQMNLDDESDIEGVSDTVFDDKADSLGHEHTQNLSPNEKENSSDPFNLYHFFLNKHGQRRCNFWFEIKLFLSHMDLHLRENSNMLMHRRFKVWKILCLNVARKVSVLAF
ncbi:hypothetical protein Tco_0369792 [Tanacetum coccineum]